MSEGDEGQKLGKRKVEKNKEIEGRMSSMELSKQVTFKQRLDKVMIIFEDIQRKDSKEKLIKDLTQCKYLRKSSMKVRGKNRASVQRRNTAFTELGHQWQLLSRGKSCLALD